MGVREGRCGGRGRQCDDRGDGSSEREGTLSERELKRLRGNQLIDSEMQ